MMMDGTPTCLEDSKGQCVLDMLTIQSPVKKLLFIMKFS